MLPYHPATLSGALSRPSLVYPLASLDVSGQWPVYHAAASPNEVLFNGANILPRSYLCQGPYAFGCKITIPSVEGIIHLAHKIPYMFIDCTAYKSTKPYRRNSSPSPSDRRLSTLHAGCHVFSPGLRAYERHT